MFGRLKPEKAEKTRRRSIDGMRNPLGLVLKKEDSKKQKPQSTETKMQNVVADEAAWKKTEVVMDRSDVVDGQTAQETRRQRAERIQNRIINYFNADLAVSVTPEEIVGLGTRALKELKQERHQSLRRAALEATEPRASVEQRVKFLQRWATGEIGDEEKAEFLLVVRGPLGQLDSNAAEILTKLRQDSRKMQILVWLLGLKMTSGQKIDEKALINMLTQVNQELPDYRTPIVTMERGRKFLQKIQLKATPDLYQKYEKSLGGMMGILYGERWEYYLQMQQLEVEARELALNSNPVAMKVKKLEVAEVSAEQSGEMLGRAVIDGDPWRGGQIERHLNTHNLAEAKLGPVYAVEIDQMQIYLSRMFQLPNGYIGVVAYIPEGESVQVRAYYKNNMQVLWRYLPDYTRRSDGSMDRYCLGQAEESVTLPAELQGALAEIEHKYGVYMLDETRGVAEFYIAGTAHAYNSLQEYQTLWSYGRMKGDYYTQVSRDPLNHDFGLSGLNQKKAPYTLSIDYNRAPDFGQKIVEFETITVDAGPITVEGFASHDGQYNWLFCKDARSRAWIEWVEAVSPLTTMGLRRDWVTMGDFTTSLYEHTNQAGIYGDRGDTKGARQGMWKNYLSNIPLIQEYTRRNDRG